jgi:hypothetical protein
VEAGNSGGSGTAASSIPPEHFTGSFDVVIEQSTADRGIPEAANFLHGKPVYTVYVQMQDVKEWILEYCFEEDRSPDRAGSAVVILTAPPRVDAPFPLEMIRPLGRLTTKSRYLLLHGTINTEGKPVGFQSGYTDDPEYAKAAVNAVGLWKFRPAKRDGVPAVVEAVLAIPSAGK